MRNKLLDLAIVIIIAFIFLYIFVFSKGSNSLIIQLTTLNIKWIAIGVSCIIVFWILEIIILFIITRKLYNTKYLFVKTIKAAMTGQFFSAITPLQLGAQPSQFYVLTENEIPPGISGSVLMIKFIIHQATFTFYSILVLVSKYSYFKARVPYFISFCIFGFIFNVLIIGLALIFSFNERLTVNILRIIFEFMKKIRIVKDYKSKYIKIEGEIKSFHENSILLYKNINTCFFSSILTFLQWTVYYSIPFCIYKSFGLSSSNLWTMICAQVFLTLFMSFIPLPGAAVGAEGGFYLIFGIFFEKNIIMPAIFLWRMITYYGCVAVGGISTIILPNIKTKKLRSFSQKERDNY